MAVNRVKQALVVKPLLAKPIGLQRRSIAIGAIGKIGVIALRLVETGHPECELGTLS